MFQSISKSNQPIKNYTSHEILTALFVVPTVYELVKVHRHNTDYACVYIPLSYFFYLNMAYLKWTLQRMTNSATFKANLEQHLLPLWMMTVQFPTALIISLSTWFYKLWKTRLLNCCYSFLYLIDASLYWFFWRKWWKDAF